MTRWAPILAVLLVLAAAAYGLWPAAPERPGERYSLQGLLGGDSGGYAHADSVRQFHFPADHGAHPDFRSEWWYLTGNLAADDGTRYGFQFTVFRFALSPRPREGRSAWGTRQAYMAHFALTDIDGGRIHTFERFSRGALGLAGATGEPFRVWLDDWELASEGEALFPWRLQVAEEEVSLSLDIATLKPLVLQGDRGLSRKGPEQGNASYYYSYTRLAAEGELRLGEKRLHVGGSAWLDREWSTSVLSPEVRGWDWFSLQLDDGSELMLYQLRTEQGIVKAFGAGMHVPASGPSQPLSGADFQLKPTAHWVSPHTRIRYPVQWRVRIPPLQTELTVTAAIPDQELDLSVRYWEGALKVQGTRQGQPVGGVGYMELTGYGTERGVRGR
jgi:predicted secreted hydrolase